VNPTAILGVHVGGTFVRRHDVVVVEQVVVANHRSVASPRQLVGDGRPRHRKFARRGHGTNDGRVVALAGVGGVGTRRRSDRRNGSDRHRRSVVTA
jgi:hypothetical protein